MRNMTRSKVVNESVMATADRAYWAGIFRTHRKAMCAAAVRQLGLTQSHLGHSAKSVVQDVMLHLIEKGEVLKAVSVEGYLVAAVKNRAVDVLRQVSRQRDHLGEEVTVDDVWREPSAEDVADAATDAVIRDQTRQILETMDPGFSRAFTERVMMGRKFTEIGRDMGVSDVQARRLCFRAIEEIQKRTGVNPGKTKWK